MGLVEVAQGTSTKKLIKKVSDCFIHTIPHTDWMSGNAFYFDYIVNISFQWDPLNHHDYLHWWEYDGPEAWRAECHFNDTIRRCLQPFMEERIDLNNYHKETGSTFITESMYYLALCEHQAVLANNAVCIHNRMLSDDVLRCSGVLGWMRGNMWLIMNKKLYKTVKIMMEKSYVNVLSALYECIYRRGQWKRACGEGVDQTMSKIKDQFVHLSRTYPRFYANSEGGVAGPLCDVCQEESNLKVYEHFNYMICGLSYDLLSIKILIYMKSATWWTTL